MTDTPLYQPQGDLFATYIPYLPLRHQHEVMERPFFSLSKNARTSSIQYTSPDGKTFVKVSPGSDHPMATIYDQDILIGAISILIERRKNRANDLSRTLHFYPQDLLRMIGRKTGGKDYMALRAGLARLKATTITTNIRALKKEKHAMFNWIDAFTDETDRNAMLSHGMSITLSDWLYDGAMMEGGVLKLSPNYFKLRGGYERWLYLIARKHAGGSGPTGFSIKFSTLYEKSGTESKPRFFKFAILEIIRKNELPDYKLHVPDESAPDPMLHITRRIAPADNAAALDGAHEEVAAPQDAGNTPHSAPEEGPIPKSILAQLTKEIPHFLPAFLKRQYDDFCRARGSLPLAYGKEFLAFARDYAGERLPRPATHTPQANKPSPQLLPAKELSDATRNAFRSQFPGYDIHYMERMFSDWLKDKKQPDKYEAAFLGFAKSHATKNPL